jgi:hypothetical protein
MQNVYGWISRLSLVAVSMLAGCTYNQLQPGAESVIASPSRPAGSCKSLGTLTGKGGGATGGWVSNEDLMTYAVNDLRNQAKELGATHVVTLGPSLGGDRGTTTSAMVMGEALKCEPGAEHPAPAPVHATAKGGCEYDAQCKGDRVCVNHECVTASAAAPTPIAQVPSAAPATSSSAAPVIAPPPAPSVASPAVPAKAPSVASPAAPAKAASPSAAKASAPH